MTNNAKELERSWEQSLLSPMDLVLFPTTAFTPAGQRHLATFGAIEPKSASVFTEDKIIGLFECVFFPIFG